MGPQLGSHKDTKNRLVFGAFIRSKETGWYPIEFLSTGRSCVMPNP